MYFLSTLPPTAALLAALPPRSDSIPESADACLGGDRDDTDTDLRIPAADARLLFARGPCELLCTDDPGLLMVTAVQWTEDMDPLRSTVE